NTSITARNLLVSNCGKNIYLVKGGNYNFTHTTASTISSAYVQHKDPILVLTNFISENGVNVTRPLNAVFRNSIFWGEENGFFDNEVVVQIQGANTPVVFDHVLWRVKTPPANSTITNAINQNPEFETINTADRIYSFRLKSTSPAINKGVQAGVTLDLDGNTRPVGIPDLGAYEKQ
ncbi:MAG: choice-of-anchor Q domain-containing protein, partial [Flavitalea sp.]